MPGLTIMATYLYFVLSWGPRYMQHRKPYDLTNLLVLYNMAQVFISIFIFYEVSSKCYATYSVIVTKTPIHIAKLVLKFVGSTYRAGCSSIQK